MERLVAAANPSKVILFGSYARGDATEDSDLDLMVIEREASNKLREMAHPPLCILTRPQEPGRVCTMTWIH